jgi:hypothetical protein
MATSQTCCHLPGKMLNSAAKCADKARILEDETVQILAWRRRKRDKKKKENKIAINESVQKEREGGWHS